MKLMCHHRRKIKIFTLKLMITIVPQYIDDQDVKDNNYVVTYSEEDNSILGWAINIKKDGQQQPDVYLKLDQEYEIYSFVLYKKTLIFCYYDNDDQNCKYLL